MNFKTHYCILKAMQMLLLLIIVVIISASGVEAQGPSVNDVPEQLAEFDYVAGQVLFNQVPQSSSAAQANWGVWQARNPAPDPTLPSPNGGPSSAMEVIDITDRWRERYADDLEGSFPDSKCKVRADGPQRLWGQTTPPVGVGALSGEQAIWPAFDGADGLDPVLPYPPNMDSWLTCGPYYGNAEKILIRFGRWLATDDKEDFLLVGISPDDHWYRGVKWSGQQDWTRQNLYITQVKDLEFFWIGFAFISDNTSNDGAGAWVDDIELWRYNTPSAKCGVQPLSPPSSKGLHLPAYDPTAGETLPMIRSGDTLALEGLREAGSYWTRLGVVHQGNGIVDLRAYDRMIDTLCHRGAINTLLIINHETLNRNDWQTDPVAYRPEFAQTAAFLVRHFQDRVKYFEIWNEPNLDEGNPSPFIRPADYAELLHATYPEMKKANPSAQVLFGGLAGAWNGSLLYFNAVYEHWNRALGRSRPFDIFAVHPYPNEVYGPDPAYLTAPPELEVGERTIVDRFFKSMAGQDDGFKKGWVTEVGWNSSLGSGNEPTCQWPFLTTEQDQARFLKPAFDTLLDVRFWNNPDRQAIERVFWFQFMDQGIENPCVTLAANAPFVKVYPNSSDLLPAGQGVDWWFGLFQGDKKTPKDVFYHFRAYPNEPQWIFIPLVIR